MNLYDLLSLCLAKRKSKEEEGNESNDQSNNVARFEHVLDENLLHFEYPVRIRHDVISSCHSFPNFSWLSIFRLTYLQSLFSRCLRPITSLATWSQVTVLHVSFWFQNEHPSSKLNRTPPMGAPKAAENKRTKHFVIISFDHIQLSYLENTQEMVQDSYKHHMEAACSWYPPPDTTVACHTFQRQRTIVYQSQ